MGYGVIQKRACLVLEFLKNRFYGFKISFGSGSSVDSKGKKKPWLTFWTSKMEEYKEDKFKK
jgi:hypothetical protein